MPKMPHTLLAKYDSQDRKMNRVPIKRFGNGRLYSTEADTYVSLTDLGDMLVNGKRIVAEGAETGERTLPVIF